MKLTKDEAGRGLKRLGWRQSILCSMGLAVLMALGAGMAAQGVATTTVQGTVYLANGQPGKGTLTISWPAFTTAAGQAIAADRMTVAVAADGFVSVNLAPNHGATPAGEYYTAVYYMSDGSTSTEYWVVPTGAQATLAQVRAQPMPAAQAVQAVNKTYVDQSISQLQQSLLTASGGNLSGPLYLNGDPSQALQAADKHYVDTSVSAAAANAWPSLVLRADQFAGGDFGAKLQACVNAVSASYGGTCDARNFTGSQQMSTDVTISTANTTVLLPCATIATANQIVVTAGTRNVALRGCALRGGSAANGSQGGTALAYSGAGATIQVGDASYQADTPGFHLDNVVINTTASSSPSAQGLVAYRTQEMDVESVYFLGNGNQTGMTLDGTGNYTGGTFLDDQFSGFQTAVNAIGHQAANPATTDWMNASAFVRLHIDCPTSNGNPIAGTTGINLQQGDGNSFTGGDVEGCATALHLGANAQNNTIVGLRNENSSSQVVADAGSSYNNWMTGGTMFTGKLTDNGTRNSFLDTFHRSFNGMNGDWYGSQQDATLTNHYRLGTGNGNERGLLDRYQTDYGYRWTTGLSDATGGEQFFLVLDELNNVNRISIGQYNNGQSSTNNQTVINSAGTGAVVLNGSNNSGTGGVVVGSGGPSETTVATISNGGNAQFNGTLQVNGTSQSNGTMTVRNSADAEVDYYLWPGKTASQKGSFTYKDWNGNSQWYMVKDASNNWALNSALGGLDSLKAYQSTNSGDTYINASNGTGAVRVNYESGSGTAFKVYGGNSSTVYASFTGAGSIAFPGLASGAGHSCLQVDTSGYVTNTGSECGIGSGGGGTVSSSSSGYIAYYTGNGSSIGGMSSVPVTAGGTGAATPATALANLGALPLTGGNMTGTLNGTSASFSGNVTAGTAVMANANGVPECSNSTYPGLQACFTAMAGGAGTLAPGTYQPSSTLVPASGGLLKGAASGSGSGSASGTGAVIQPNSALTGYAYSGATASAGLYGGGLSNLTFDMTAAASASGAVDLTNISTSNETNLHVILPASGSMKAFNFNMGSYGGFWNTLVAPWVSLAGGNPNNHTAYYFSNSANSETLLGAASSRIGTHIDIEGANAVNVLGGGTDAWTNNCVVLGGSAWGNVVKKVRCETAAQYTAGASNPAVVWIKAGASNNDVDVYGSSPQFSGATPINDLSGMNNWDVEDLSGQYARRMFGGRYPVMFGFNTGPGIYFSGGPGGGIDLNGAFEWNYYGWNKDAGDYRLYASPEVPTSSYSAWSVSSDVLTVTAANVYAAGAHVTCSTATGTSIAGSFVVLASPAPTSSQWSAAINAANGSGSGIGTCWQTDTAVTNAQVTAGVITVTALNSWNVGSGVNLKLPTGPLYFLSGGYSVAGVINAGAGQTGWTANTPTYSLTQVNACPSGGCASGIPGVIQFNSQADKALPGMVITATIQGTYSALSGQYTVSGFNTTTGLIEATYSGSTDTGGTQSACGGTPSVCGTTQIYTAASTAVLGTETTGPVQIMGTDASNNLTLSAPASGANIILANPVQLGSTGPALSSTSSSTGTQLVNCAPGGTTSQYCGADGAWHTPPGSGTNTQVGSINSVIVSTTPNGVTTSGSFSVTSGVLSQTTWHAGGYTTIANITVAGMYQACGWVNITTAGTVSGGSPTLALYLDYTTDGAVKTPQLGAAVAPQTVGSWNSPNSGQTPCLYFYADAGTTVKYELIVGGTGTITGAPAFRLGMTVINLGS